MQSGVLSRDVTSKFRQCGFPKACSATLWNTNTIPNYNATNTPQSLIISPVNTSSTLNSNMDRTLDEIVSERHVSPCQPCAKGSTDDGQLTLPSEAMAMADLVVDFVVAAAVADLIASAPSTLETA